MPIVDIVVDYTLRTLAALEKATGWLMHVQNQIGCLPSRASHRSGHLGLQADTQYLQQRQEGALGAHLHDKHGLLVLGHHANQRNDVWVSHLREQCPLCHQHCTGLDVLGVIVSAL